jgi:hypothetical protein
MTKDNLVKLHKHYSFLSKGKFSSADFSVEGINEDAGRTMVGKLTPHRVALIVSDALINLKDLETKYPFLKEKEVK